MHQETLKNSLSSAEKEILTATHRYLKAWSYQEVPPDLSVFRDIFMEGSDAIVTIDNFNNEVTVTHSVDEYINTWQPSIGNIIAKQTVTSDEPIQVLVSDNFAVSMLSPHPRGELTDGRPHDLPQIATLVWVRNTAGEWRLIREHITAL